MNTYGFIGDLLPLGVALSTALEGQPRAPTQNARQRASCAYCGSIHAETNCPNCGAVAKAPEKTFVIDPNVIDIHAVRNGVLVRMKIRGKMDDVIRQLP